MSAPRWYFTEEQLANSPSRKCGINSELELSYRQRAANLIQEMGQRLQVSQLCINTAIVYMHRFYAFHSFTMFHRNTIAAAAFFLAAKVEEQPRKLEHVIKILNICLEKTDVTRDMYADQAQELVLNENILLQTLGFDVAIDHPHTHVVKACQLFNIVTVSRELRQTCYFMASNSLHLTTMCLKYRPTVVAAFCIYIACKWSRWEIPDSSEGKAWYSYVDESVTLDTLQKLTDEYLQILERSPSKFKSKMKAITTSNGQAGVPQNPSMGESSSSSHHKNQNHHDKHHHHHHRSASTSSTSSSVVNSAASMGGGGGGAASNGSSRKQYPISNDQKSQLHQPSNSSYKQPTSSVSSSSTVAAAQAAAAAQMHRQRPPYSTGSGSNSSSGSNANKSLDERQQRHQQQQPQDPYYGTSQSSAQQQQQQRMSEKHRMSMSSSQQQQQGYMKTGSDQKLNSSGSSKAHPAHQQPPPYPLQDIHSKSLKHLQSDYHNPRNNPMTQMIHQANLHKKNNSWNQQQLPPLQIPVPQINSQPSQQQQQQHQQMQFMQKNLPMHLSQSQQQQPPPPLPPPAQQPQLPSTQDITTLNNNNNNNNNSKSQQMMNYGNAEMKTSQNDFWFNDALPPAISPPRQTQSKSSLFSPSPEHASDDKAKYMMMASIKRDNLATVVESVAKEEKKTPSKRDKLAMSSGSASKAPQISPVDKKFLKNELNPPSTVDLSSLSALTHDTSSSMASKKRPYSSVKESLETSGNARSEKIRKTDSSKMAEPGAPSRVPQLFGSSMESATASKQPIETNPDHVKSLLKECFSSSNKFGPFDSDSPLDVINPEPPEELLAVPHIPSSSLPTAPITNSIANAASKKESLLESAINKTILGDAGAADEDKMDSSANEGSSSGKHKKKSKKKKEKHKHKKKHKHSDREGSPSMRLVVSKSNSPESNSAFGGGLKIKIPIKDVAAAMNPQQQQQAPPQGALNPAPIKLKLSKEKFGSFTNLNNNNSSSSPPSSSHKKKKEKDKHRDKEKSKKSSKHREGGDGKMSADFKESYHHQ